MPKTSAGKSSPFSKRVAESIENARIEAGVTQAELFKGADMSSNYFYVRMRGELPFNTNDIEKLAAVMNLNPMLILRSAARPALSVVPDLQTDDLQHAELDVTKIAATKKRKAVDPGRGES